MPPRTATTAFAVPAQRIPTALVDQVDAASVAALLADHGHQHGNDFAVIRNWT
jgi:hypothetical protein